MPSVCFLPYFPNPMDEVIGDYHVWKWWQHRERHVTDANVRAVLDEYFALYTMPSGEREERITIIGRPGQPIFDDTNFPSTELARLTSVIAVSHLLKLPTDLNQGWRACTSDNFISYSWPFSVDRGLLGVAFSFGSYVTTTVAGGRETLRFTTPPQVPNTIGCLWHRQLLDRAAVVLASANPTAARTFQSMNWVRFAFSNDDSFRLEARVVAMATAFEMLLDLPDKGKGRHFSERVNALLPPNRLLQTVRRLGRTDVPDNAVGWWCRDFYALRSRIVHGDMLTVPDLMHNGVEHLRIGLSIYGECLRGMLIRDFGAMTEAERAADFGLDWQQQLALPDDVWYP